jgi:hypothetical protein
MMCHRLRALYVTRKNLPPHLFISPYIVSPLTGEIDRSVEMMKRAGEQPLLTVMLKPSG